MGWVFMEYAYDSSESSVILLDSVFFFLRDISSFGLAWNRFDDVFSSGTTVLATNK
jgi:hypothetical protein